MKSLVIAAALLFAPFAHAQDATVPECQSSQLAFSIDNTHDSDFNGMSHAGTTLVLQNKGDSTCRLVPFVHVTLTDSNHHVLETIAKAPGSKFMHPGPVVMPTMLQPGQAATASMRWVSGEVFQRSVCIDPIEIIATVGTKTLSIPFSGHLCGEASQPVAFDLSRFSAPSTAR